jgi:hypothetical protein
VSGGALPLLLFDVVQDDDGRHAASAVLVGQRLVHEGPLFWRRVRWIFTFLHVVGHVLCCLRWLFGVSGAAARVTVRAALCSTPDFVPQTQPLLASTTAADDRSLLKQYYLT